MITTKKVNELIEELEKEKDTCLEEDQFGYPKQDAYDVYKSIIERLKEIIKEVEEMWNSKSDDEVDSEAQATDAAEFENHRRDVEGEII